MKTVHTIIHGDSRKMNAIADRSIHLVVTSPPYWQLKDYGSATQIGFNDSYEQYINNLNMVWKECYRVLDNGCRLCVNIGDQFARSVYYGRYKVIPIRTEIIKFCEALGFDYLGAIIWQKKTTTNTTGGASLMGSFPYPRNGIVSIDYEFILLFKKLGKPTPPKKELKEASRMTTQEWTTYFSGHWNFGGVKQSGHLAMFPVELPTRLIKMFSFKNDTVLDPFLGSGTTTLAARNLERNSVGYEINEEFIEYTRKKLNITQNDIEGTQYQYLQDHSEVDYDKEIEQFPYTFTDFHGFNNKIDPKKLQFGSKIDKNSTRREKYYTVRSVISPELIQLNDGLQVKLLGVKKKESVNGQAIAFLNRKLTGQKVFLKFDRKKYDDNNTLLCYVYLKNMTFINAHLIKKGLAHVNEAEEFSYKDTFRKIEQ